MNGDLKTPSPRSNRPSVPKRGWRTLIILLVLALVLSAVGGYHWWLSSGIDRRLAHVRASGEPVTLAELNDYYPQVPAASNAALIYARAFEILRKVPSLNFLEKLDELPAGSDPLPTEMRRSMEKACQEAETAFEVLDQAGKLKLCRYPVDYAPGWAASMPYLRDLRSCSALEMSKGVLDEQSGDMEHSIMCIETILQFSASLNAEPDLISVLVQRRLEQHATELLRWLMNHRHISQPQLSRLQMIFEGAEHSDRLEKALAGERCFIIGIFQSSPGTIVKTIDPKSEDNFATVLNLSLLRVSGALKRDELHCLERVDQTREILRLSFPERIDQAQDLRNEITDEAFRRRFILTGILFPGFLKGIERDADALARRRVVLTALALEQYRNARNALPASLSELTPRFLPRVPMDPFADESLLYLREGVDYVIHSVGPDRHDDGGKSPLQRDPKLEHPKGDIVFRVSRAE